MTRQRLMNYDLTPLDNEPQKSLDLFVDLRRIISRGKPKVVVLVNSILMLTYWNVGKRINADVLQVECAAYGKQIIPSLAEELVEQYGRSFETENLRRLMQFAEVFRDPYIVVPLVRQFSSKARSYCVLWQSNTTAHQDQTGHDARVAHRPYWTDETCRSNHIYD